MAYLEPAPLASINEYGGTRYAPTNGNNIGVGVGYAELSAAVGPYRIGLLYRAEVEGNAARDILDVLHANYYGQTFDVGRTYRLYYNARILKAEGLRLRRALILGELHGVQVGLGVGVSLLKATQGRQESLAGEVTATAPEYAVGTGTWLRTASDLSLSSFNPFVGAGHATGIGFSTDIQLTARSQWGTAVELTFMDPGGRIYWHDIRSSLRTLDNSTIRYDENFNREALINGVDSRINDVQRIPTKYELALTQPMYAGLSALIKDDSVNGLHFPSLGGRYGSDRRFGAVTFDVRTHAVGVTGGWSLFQASVTANRWRPTEATVLGASLEISSTW